MRACRDFAPAGALAMPIAFDAAGVPLRSRFF